MPISSASISAPTGRPRHSAWISQPIAAAPPTSATHGQNAALAAGPFGALRPVELVVEERDCPPGEHDRMRHEPEHRPHVAEQRVDRQAGKQQQQRIVQGWRSHRGGNLGCDAAGNQSGAINRGRNRR